MYRTLVLSTRILDALVTALGRAANKASVSAARADIKAKVVRSNRNDKAMRDAAEYARHHANALVRAKAAYASEKQAIDAAHPMV